MPVFEFSSRFQCPVEKLWQFHEREDVITLLMPPFPPAKLLRQDPGLAAGVEKEFTVGIWPLRFRWLALHKECRPGERFADLQIEGPFRHWYHEHLFEPDGAGSRLTDRVDYAFFGGALIDPVLRWQLKSFFTHRHAVTRRYVEGHS